MSLSATQLVNLQEITRETLEDVTTAAADLTTEQTTIIAADIVTWNLIRDSHVKLKGGSKGVDFDNARKRAAIFYRIRNILGFEFAAFDLNADTLELVEFEVGANFG